MRNDFKDMSPRRRFIVAVATLISLVVVTLAERDIQRRPDSGIRGSKLLWRLFSLNAVGAGAYLGWGRRRGSGP
jgi:hypothetical protein